MKHRPEAFPSLTISLSFSHIFLQIPVIDQASSLKITRPFRIHNTIGLALGQETGRYGETVESYFDVEMGEKNVEEEREKSRYESHSDGLITKLPWFAYTTINSYFWCLANNLVDFKSCWGCINLYFCWLMFDENKWLFYICDFLLQT